jgi:hypothetical protein
LKVLADNAIDELPEYEPQSPAIGTRTSSARNAFREPARLGDLLVEAGMITPAQLESALAQQSSWGARLGDVLLAMGWVKPLEFYQILAGHFDVSFVNLKEEPADAALFDPTEYADYAKHQYLPWRMRDGILWIVVADPTSAWMEQRWGHRDDVYFVMTSSLEILAELQRVAGAQFSEDAVYYLANFAPEHSARTVVTTNQ